MIMESIENFPNYDMESIENFPNYDTCMFLTSLVLDHWACTIGHVLFYISLSRDINVLI